MKKTILVNLVGAPGVGKSLFSALLYAELKLRGESVEYVQEYVKNLVWQDRIDEISNQYYVSYQQYKMLKAVDGKVDYIVTDGSLMHGLYYNSSYWNNVSDVEKTREMILQKQEEFNNVYIFLQHGQFKYETEGRIHTKEESVKISVELEDQLKELNCEYLKVVSDTCNLPKMVDYVIDRRKKVK